MTEQAAQPKAMDLSSASAAQVAIGAMSELGKLWEISTAQLLNLLGLSQTSFYRFKSGTSTGGLDPSTQERVSYLLRIQGALEVLLPRQQADCWVSLPNTAPLFGGRSALEHMLGGQLGDLKEVADYLDSQRGGDFA
jgi:hypothetical protein